MYSVIISIWGNGLVLFIGRTISRTRGQICAKMIKATPYMTVTKETDVIINGLRV